MTNSVLRGRGDDEDDEEVQTPLKPKRPETPQSPGSPELPEHRDLTGDVPTAPDPDLGPGETKDVQDPPGHEAISDLPG